VAWGRPQLLAAPAVAPVTAPGAGRRVADHVIVWVVSALRYDRFAVDPPLPGFARLLERGIRFLHATSAAPAPGPAHVALMTGRHPSGSRVPDEAETLAERFRGAGYATALISGNGFVHDEAGFARGFDTYSNPMRLRHPFGARILWQKARRVLTQHRDGHVFLYLATVEPHLPYTPAEPLPEPWSGRAMRFAPADTAEVSERVRAGQERLSEEEQAYVVALYDAEVREAAAAVGEMLADLEQLGLADRTAIVLVADHGEELWERGRFGHGDGLYQETLHVPLVVVPPGLTSPQVVEREVELIDVFPTVLDLAGIAVNPSCQGRSLLGREADEEQLPPPVQAHLPGWGRSLRLGRYQLVVPLRGGHQLYDLTGDPAQREDLAGSLPLVERYLRNVFGLAVAYQTPWSRPRWGAANNTKPAFAADHGL
jgi:arylsulfatase A-like enzyme